MTGSVLSQDDMDRAFTASSDPVDAVVGFLNATRTSDMPWAKPLAPPRFMADSAANAVASLRKYSTNSTQKPRIVILSALGVGDSLQVTPLILRLLVKHTNLGVAYKDHNLVDSEIEANCGDEIDWTLARAVMLGGNGKEVKAIKGNQKGASSSISRQSCAEWLVDVAAGEKGDEYSKSRVIISN